MKNYFTHFIDRYGSKDAAAEADLQLASRVPGATPLAEVAPRVVCTVAGVIRSVTRSTMEDAPRLDITVTDGTGQAAAQFFGRREISGMSPGRVVVLHGRFCRQDNELMAHNPGYELLGGTEED